MTARATDAAAAETVAEVRSVSRHYGAVTALDDVSFTLAPDRIYGLLGRNGAGKTTLMSIMTGQEFASSGEVRVFAEHPLENPGVLQRISFIKESQKYPDGFRGSHVLGSAPWFFPHWNQGLADRLVDEFRLPVKREVKKMSRGQLSALGVTLGLASRAPVTFFDEPYLGLDAVARQYFYDTLLADFAEHPRTVVLSTHLIDEVANLLEHVLLLEQGRLILDEDAETLRERATTVTGKANDVDRFIRGRQVLARERLGGILTATVSGQLAVDDRRAAGAIGLELGPVSLQQLVVSLTRSHETGPISGAAPAAQSQERA